MTKKKILFICVHNSARSQMAEALTNSTCGEEWAAESAGLTPGALNPLAVEVMAEIGLEYFEEGDARCLQCMAVGRNLQPRRYGVR